jgi:hypothetical protein
MIVNRDEGVGRVNDHRLKDFSWLIEGLIHTALADRADLNEVVVNTRHFDKAYTSNCV